MRIILRFEAVKVIGIVDGIVLCDCVVCARQTSCNSDSWIFKWILDVYAIIGIYTIIFELVAQFHLARVSFIESVFFSFSSPFCVCQHYSFWLNVKNLSFKAKFYPWKWYRVLFMLIAIDSKIVRNDLGEF